ncbi:hypothetical protein I0F14_03135 [Klebsiella pneumoniae]|uniref:hypothetical protein n=1 Tax=Klebsiella pneumoniae TaxID=573 RepID=UPI0018A2F4C6|nr:hypothetical protein [Klebsiella pneumoniae]MBF7792114.1 hypothetical protein [Klebsiella pneumoniae]MBF7797047.1 hypothetical protein [Klebsiella pneumoniae]HCA6517421.1 hypothetical protein [Klebsiella pneumoniae]HCA6853728.1 hypothetical protein [Klebsiella pneumoniae]HCA6879709.1 hypothetical protein [Klebsiella pneumoniae]
MMKMHWTLNFVGALLMATANQQANDAGGLIFGIMVVVMSALIVIMEVNRRQVVCHA